MTAKWSEIKRMKGAPPRAYRRPLWAWERARWATWPQERLRALTGMFTDVWVDLKRGG